MGSGLRRQAKCGGIKNGREWGGFKEEMSACLFQGMEKPSGGRGMPFFALALV